MQDRLIPLTIVSGFLGAGKTTLLNHLLKNNEGRSIGVLVNDFGAINIDADLVAGSTKESIRLTNGCVCCTIRDDLVEAVSRLVLRPDPPEHIVVETSGVSEPRPVADTFSGLAKEEVVIVDGVVTVVDAERFPEYRGKDRALALRQLRAADLVVLNKIDLLSAGQEEKLARRIRRRVPWARLWPSNQARIPLDVLLGHGRAERPAGPLDDPDPDHTELETMSLVSERPVAIYDVQEAVRRLPPSIFRAKGILRVAGRPDRQTVLQVVGRRARVELGPPWGDTPPTTRIVFIGRDALPAEAALEALFWPGGAPLEKGALARVIEFLRPQ